MRNSTKKLLSAISNIIGFALLGSIVMFVLVQNYLQMKSTKKNSVAKDLPISPHQNLMQKIHDTHLFAKRMNTKFMQELHAQGTHRRFDFWIAEIQQRQQVLAESAKECMVASIGKYRLQDTIRIVEKLLHTLTLKQCCIEAMRQRQIVNENKIMCQIKLTQLRGSVRDNMLRTSLYSYEYELTRQKHAYLQEEKELHRKTKTLLEQVKTAMQHNLTPS